jgi:hypothetical protein
MTEFESSTGTLEAELAGVLDGFRGLTPELWSVGVSSRW